MGEACSAPAQEPQEFFAERGFDSGRGGNGGYGDSRGSYGQQHAARGSNPSFVAQLQQGKEKAREWQRQIKTEIRQLDRDTNQIRREEEKLKREIKLLAKQGKNDQVRNTAKHVVRLRRSVARLEKTKNSMTAMNLHLTTQIATMSSASAVQVSTAMMKEANQLLNVQEMYRTMEEMQREMAKAQAADEVMEEGFEEPEDETEIDSELKKVYDEVALDASLAIGPSGGGHAMAAAAPPTGTRLPAGLAAVAPQVQRVTAEEPSPFSTIPPEDYALDQNDPLQRRLEALR